MIESKACEECDGTGLLQCQHGAPRVCPYCTMPRTRARPRLTPKVLRGLSTVEAHAHADREAVSADELTPSLRRTIAELDDGLQYIRELRAWFNNREKKS